MAFSPTFDHFTFSLYLALVGILVNFIFKGWRARRTFNELRKQGLPMPPWSPIFGHLLAILPYVKLFPRDASQTYIIAELAKDFPDSDGSLYLDVWPFAFPILVVTSAELATQACQQHDLPRPTVLLPFFKPFTGAGGMNIFTANGAEWKRSRTLFNSGFSASYLLSQMSHIVKEASVFVDILRDHAAKDDIFSLDPLTCRFTMDIIGAVTINSRLRFQTQSNPLASAMRSQVRWHYQDNEINPFVRLNPIRPIVQWYNGRQMEAYISKELDKRFISRLSKKDTPTKSIMDLVLDGYIADSPSFNMDKGLDAKFKQWAIAEIRTFLFVGHDSTAATICHCYYLLWRNPDTLARVRAEHDEVFGSDAATVAEQLLQDPKKINALTYTNAVLKETMRLFPAAAGMRGGLPGVDLLTTTGMRLPTEGTSVWLLHLGIQRSTKYWPEPNKFIPERWLVGPEDPLHPTQKGAYRPFEFGPRNCVGQALVMQDMKTTLAMTIREFDIRDAYAEWDQLNPSRGLKTARGERAYQVFAGSSHPADGFPCKVSFRALAN